MQSKNYFVKQFRINKEMDGLISDVVLATGFPKTKIYRWLFNRALKQLKSDFIDAGGVNKMNFTIEEIRRINR